MAINWQPIGSSEAVVIGGSVADAGNVIAGPFPKFSISRECIRKDNLYLGQKYNINITGTAVIVKSSNMLEIGKRQTQIHDIVKKLMRVNNKQGKLYIEDYGGTSQVLTFNDAVLLSVDAAEQTDDSRGVQVQQYTFAFEARDLNKSDEDDTEPEGSPYNVIDVTENWEFSLNEGSYTQTEYEKKAVGEVAKTANVKKNYAIAHSLSATGVTKLGGVSNESVSSGYYEAKRYIQNRLNILGNNPFNANTIKDYGAGVPSTDTVGQHNIFESDDREGSRVNLRPYAPDTAKYTAYNQVNTYSQDILAGTYSVNRNWLASAFAANVSIDLTYNDDDAAAANTVEVSVNIQGHESIVEDTLKEEDGTITTAANPNTETTDKYHNALSVAETYFLNEDATTGKTGIFSIAEAFYAERAADGTLKAIPVSKSQSHSQTTGAISLSSSFHDATITVSGAVSENITISDTNYDGTNQIVAILPVIGKSDGPVIQNMGITNERTRSVSVEIVMAKGNRESKPDIDLSSYRPSTTAYQQNISDSWSPTSGSYNKSIDWVFTGAAQSPPPPDDDDDDDDGGDGGTG